jgi:hypothetical protein
MDCKSARLLLDFHRPRAGDLAPDEAAELEGHLATCAECDAAARAQRGLDEHLGRAVRDVPLPAKLRERLLAGVRERHRAATLRKLAWAARGAAVAATLLLAVALWWHFVGSRPSRLDVGAVVEADFAKYNALTPQAVEVWFQERHRIAMVAPKQFDYGYLAEYELATLQGKPVPKLVFQRAEDNGITRARVFVLKRDEFDLEALPRDPPEVESLGRRLTIWDPEAPDTAYLIIYEGESLNPLIDRNKVPGRA